MGAANISTQSHETPEGFCRTRHTLAARPRLNAETYDSMRTRSWLSRVLNCIPPRPRRRKPAKNQILDHRRRVRAAHDRDRLRRVERRGAMLRIHLAMPRDGYTGGFRKRITAATPRRSPASRSPPTKRPSRKARPVSVAACPRRCTRRSRAGTTRGRPRGRRRDRTWLGRGSFSNPGFSKKRVERASGEVVFRLAGKSAPRAGRRSRKLCQHPGHLWGARGEPQSGATIRVGLVGVSIKGDRLARRIDHSQYVLPFRRVRQMVEVSRLLPRLFMRPHRSHAGRAASTLRAHRSICSSIAFGCAARVRERTAAKSGAS